MAVTTSFTDQSENPEDAVAETEAARAREQGTDLIREHLNHHLETNPSSSYVVSLTRAKQSKRGDASRQTSVVLGAHIRFHSAGLALATRP